MPNNFWQDIVFYNYYLQKRIWQIVMIMIYLTLIFIIIQKYEKWNILYNEQGAGGGIALKHLYKYFFILFENLSVYTK